MKTLALLLVLGVINSVFAAECRLSGSVCVDTSPSKNISGVPVTLAEVGGCWEYEDTYTCIKPNAVNYCQPFVNAQPQCWQTYSQCAQMDTLFNSGCMKFTQTWRCNDQTMPTPVNTIRLDDTYTLLSSDFDPGPCASLASNASCQIAESTCISTTPPSLPPGITTSQVAPDGCYQKQNVYACFTGRSDTSECDGYASNPNCTLESSSCNPADKINGQCTFEQKTFRCMSQPGQTNTVTDCSGQLFCQNGNCFDKGYTGDTDFARSVALMEAAREAGVYGAETEIFKGFDSRCRIKLFGLANCCKKSSGGGGFSNFNLLGSALSAGGQVLDVGSSYVYDALYDGSTLQQGLGAALGVLGADGLFNPSFSFYGFSFQFLPSQGFIFTGFDPTTLAIQIGVMILQELLSCEQQEQILAMRSGQNLCHEIGTYCSSKLKLLSIKICIEHTKSYCCYNSRLARILNEQGRGRLARDGVARKARIAPVSHRQNLLPSTFPVSICPNSQPKSWRTSRCQTSAPQANKFRPRFSRRSRTTTRGEYEDIQSPGLLDCHGAFGQQLGSGVLQHQAVAPRSDRCFRRPGEWFHPWPDRRKIQENDRIIGANPGRGIHDQEFQTGRLQAPQRAPYSKRGCDLRRQDCRLRDGLRFEPLSGWQPADRRDGPRTGREGA
jgi:conjugal transfer mating pair stabilization protein TraN